MRKGKLALFALLFVAAIAAALIWNQSRISDNYADASGSASVLSGSGVVSDSTLSDSGVVSDSASDVDRFDTVGGQGGAAVSENAEAPDRQDDIDKSDQTTPNSDRTAMNNSDRTAMNNSDRTAMNIEGLELSQGEDGKIHWTLVAKQAEMTAQSGLIKAVDPYLTYFRTPLNAHSSQDLSGVQNNPAAIVEQTTQNMSVAANMQTAQGSQGSQDASAAQGASSSHGSQGASAAQGLPSVQGSQDASVIRGSLVMPTENVITVVSDFGEVDQENNNMRFIRSVRVVNADKVLLSELLEYSSQQELLVSPGPARFTSQGMDGDAGTASWSLKDNLLYASGGVRVDWESVSK